MKKLIFSVAFLALMSFGYSQKMNNVQKAYVLGNMEDAKTEIDKLSKDPKAQSNPEFWLWNASVYANIFEDSALNKKYPSAAEVAYYSLNNYQKLDPSFKIMS